MTSNLPLATGYFTHDLTSLTNPIKDAPETPDRLASIELMLMAMGFGDQLRRYEVHEAPLPVVHLAHDPSYVQSLALASAGHVEALAKWQAVDTPVGPLSYRAALKSVGAVIEAIDAVMKREIVNALCAVRPPGHHAGRRSGGGFCYFNNTAIGALYAHKRWNLERVAVLDFDVHHGDGTEEILGSNPHFQFYSLFQWPLYPNRLTEVVPSNVIRVPLEAGAGGEKLREVVETVWLPGVEAFKPQLILLSAGFDGHVEEAMAQLKMEESDFAYMTGRLMDAAEVLCDGKLVSVLEGGYSLRSLSRSVMSHIATLVNQRRKTE